MQGALCISRLRDEVALVDGGIGKAPEPVLIIVGAHVVPTDEAQKVVGAALLPLGYAFH